MDWASKSKFFIINFWIRVWYPSPPPAYSNSIAHWLWPNQCLDNPASQWPQNFDVDIFRGVSRDCVNDLRITRQYRQPFYKILAFRQVSLQSINAMCVPTCSFITPSLCVCICIYIYTYVYACSKFIEFLLGTLRLYLEEIYKWNAIR